MPNGVIIIDKPQGWTSMEVCAKLRGMFHEKRVGHAGTLDPMATGVLPVFLGRATRAVEYATDSDKEYIAGIQLGVMIKYLKQLCTLSYLQMVKGKRIKFPDLKIHNI